MSKGREFIGVDSCLQKTPAILSKIKEYTLYDFCSNASGLYAFNEARSVFISCLKDRMNCIVVVD